VLLQQRHPVSQVHCFSDSFAAAICWQQTSVSRFCLVSCSLPSFARQPPVVFASRVVPQQKQPSLRFFSQTAAAQLQRSPLEISRKLLVGASNNILNSSNKICFQSSGNYNQQHQQHFIGSSSMAALKQANIQRHQQHFKTHSSVTADQR